jgi:hypothetical protein
MTWPRKELLNNGIKAIEATLAKLTKEFQLMLGVENKTGSPN